VDFLRKAYSKVNFGYAKILDTFFSGHSLLVHKLMYWIQMNLQRFQALNVNLTFEIFLLYHIRKYVDKKLYLFSPDPLHVYSGTVKKDHLTIKDYCIHVYFTTLVLICMQI